MSYNVETIQNFETEAKKLLKKYKSLKQELRQFIAELAEDPTMGDHVGDDFYKVRLAVKSKGKGKRSGMRIITFVKFINDTVYLCSIYDKSDKDDISNKELKQFLKSIK